MTSETFKDSFDRKGQKQQNRPKLLKLTEVSMPNRSRKKSKLKVKPRSQSNVRDRIYDDPAYTDDISHLAIPIRRNSGPDKLEPETTSHKKKSSHKDGHHLKRSETNDYKLDDSSSSDNMPPDPGKNRLGHSLERSVIMEKSPNKRERRDRAAKQKRNLSLDNTLSNSLRRSLEKTANENFINFNSVDRPKTRQKGVLRQNASEGWSSCLAATSDSSKAAELEEMYSGNRKEQSKVQIGKKLLKGEIGIKSFNYYLLKEGLKSSRKFIDKQRGSLSKGDSKRNYSKSEENIYEEIFFTDKNSESEDHSKYPDCEICIRQCAKDNCEYCYASMKSHGFQAAHEGETFANSMDQVSQNAHILQYHSYNPNNPGVYKIETTPVAFTSDYNPIYHIQTDIQPPVQQPTLTSQQRYAPRRNSRAGLQTHNAFRMNAKSSSSSDSLQHKHARDRSSQDSQEFSEYTQPVILGLSQASNEYDQNIYKSDSKISIISEYSLRSESSTNRNFRCGEVSDSSLGDSLFSYSTQRRFFGSSESCRFGFECRRCSLDGEKCSFSDTCRYECRNCDCSSSYFSSDFDDGNYSRRTPTRMRSLTQTQPVPQHPTYEYYDDTIDAKQNKYAQDFIKHVNDVKRSFYQAETQRSSIPTIIDSYGTIPPPKQSDMRKIIAHHQQSPSSIRASLYETTSHIRQGKASPFKLQKQPVPKQSETQPTLGTKDSTAGFNSNKTNGRSKSDNPHSVHSDSTDLATTPSNSSGNRKSKKDTDVKYATVSKDKGPDSEGGRISPEREQKKHTGAIPKSSPAISTQSTLHASPNSSKGSEEQLMPVSQTPTQCSSRANSANTYPGNVSTNTQTSSPASETKQKNVPKSNVELPGHDGKVKKSSRRNEKEISKAYPSKNEPKSNLNITNKQPTVKLKDSNLQLTKLEPKATTHSPQPKERIKRKLLKPEPVQVSDFDDEDDEVFIDVPKQQDDKPKSKTRTKESSRKRCFALPATPNTPNKGQQGPDGNTTTTGDNSEEQTELQPLHPENASLDPTRVPSANDEQKAPLEKGNAQASTTGQQIVESAQPKQSSATCGETLNASSIVDPESELELHSCADENRAGFEERKVDSSREEVGSSAAVEAVAANEPSSSHRSDAAGATASSDNGSETKRATDTKFDGFTNNGDSNQPTSANQKTSTDDHLNLSIDTSVLDKIDISDLPLPDIPPKKKRNKTSQSTPKLTYNANEEHVSRCNIPDDEAQRSLPRTKADLGKLQDKSDLKRMHYYNSGRMPTSITSSSISMPTYFFGEKRTSGSKKLRDADEIYLNKSGWVQVNSKRSNDEHLNVGRNHRLNVVRVNSENKTPENTIRVIHIDANNSEKPVYAVPKPHGSKLEDLIARNEARRGTGQPANYHRPGYKIIDPHIASILNERPGFLPVKMFADIESPPPITPILSPPPAFQDSKSKRKIEENSRIVKHASIPRKNQEKTTTPKGMVFSRSFEYDNRKQNDYAETFSKSFDSNLSTEKSHDPAIIFGTLTGRSPNYLTKKEARSRDNSPKYQEPVENYLHSKQKADTIIYSTPNKPDKLAKGNVDRNIRSRRSQFSRTMPTNPVPTSRFRNFESNSSQRLNSCDSGARSDLSNDEIDNDDTSPSQYLSVAYQSSGYRSSRQRSITPERYESNTFQTNLRKQRSLTPESRSLTPEDRRKKGSQISLNSRQNSGSRTNTLERAQKYDDKSRSPSRSSSSSYSGGEHDIAPIHRRSGIRSTKDEHRIRRSRSLQLSERSPNRMAPAHKTVVCLGQPNVNNTSSTYHHPIRSFPPTMRPTQYNNPPSSIGRMTRSTEVDKSRSFDLDYGNYATPNISSKMDFDKTRSFDETYRESSNKLRYRSDQTSNRGDLFFKQQKLPSTIPRQTSPQNYGTRLCDHELTYDMLRRSLDRSPIMDFSRDYDVPVPSTATNRNYDMHSSRSEELNFLNENIYDRSSKRSCDQSPGEKAFCRDVTLTPESFTPESEYKSLRDSFQCGDRLQSGDYIYRQPTKGQMGSLQSSALSNQPQRSLIDRSHQQHAGASASIRGSCSASSCDFWPHCGLTNLKTSPIKSQSVEQVIKPNVAACLLTSSNSGTLSDDECEDLNELRDGPGVYSRRTKKTDLEYGIRQRDSESVPLQQLQKSAKKHVSENSKPYPPLYVNMPVISKTNPTSSAILFGEREMPVTREREKVNSNSIKIAFIEDHPDQQTVRSCIDAKIDATQNMIATNARDRVHHQDQKLRSRLSSNERSISLPNMLLQTEFPSMSASCEALFFNSSPKLGNQLKAVSSPSLSETPIEIQTEPKSQQNSGAPSFQNDDNVCKNPLIQLQLFGKKATSNPQPDNRQMKNEEQTRYRFGHLIWRSSKERRKTKYNRKDKCNSGDSGIQIELENDESFDTHGVENLEVHPSAINTRVRRVNSAKLTHSTTSCSSAKAKALKKMENCDGKLLATPIPKRSLSQPSGLDHVTRTELEESDADSIASHKEIQGHRPVYAQVLFPFTPEEPQELALERGDLVQVIRQDLGVWWYGRIKCDAVVEKVIPQREGWFPKDYIRIIPNEFETKTENEQVYSLRKNVENNEKLQPSPSRAACTILQPPNDTTVMPLKPSQSQNQQCNESLKNSVIKELLETEINYVKLLSSLCMGFLREMRKRIDIFTPESILLIFSNIESIWLFQQRFLDSLRKGIETHRIAQVFLNNCPNFMIYSTYCNSYSRALMELETYSNNKDAKCILELCRIAENLPELPLSAHLLAPIQRICRYPLHLAELLKHTQPTKSPCEEKDESAGSSSQQNIKDSRETLENALSAMKKVAETVNEGKRHSENLNRFQASFENFEGPPIGFHSTRFFLQTDATRISPNLWNNTYTLFLFDKQIIYCKKDILKRNHYIYKGRIFLDDCRILNLPDGKLFGANLKNALRIYCQSRSKWLDFCFRSPSRKVRFLSTLAAERQFSGRNLFISELAGDEDNVSDVEYPSDHDTQNRNAEFEDITWKDYNVKKINTIAPKHKFNSDTLPKKSRKVGKDNYEYSTASLGRKKIGGWFRKAKSTNTTPTQSPTHHSALTFHSDNSSQSSPALGYICPKNKTNEFIVSP